MDDVRPEENPFARVRLRGVWSWVLLSGLVIVPFAMIAVRQRWLVPGRDLFLVLGAWLYAAPLAWMAVTARRHGIRIRRWLVRPVSAGGWLEAVMIVPPQLLFSATSFMLMFALFSMLLPGNAQRLFDSPQMTNLAPPGAPRPLVAIMLVVIAPVAEELLFRGLLLHTLASRWGFGRAAFVTAAIFALLHANLIGIFSFGLVLTVLYVRTRSLLVPMLCHAVNNLIPLLLSLQTEAGTQGGRSETLAMLRSHMGPFAVAAGAAGLFMFGYIKQRWPAAGTPLPYDLAREAPEFPLEPPPSAPFAGRPFDGT